MKNSIGESVILTVFGESHGPAVGVVLDGLAPGIPVDEAYIAEQLAHRRPAGAADTARVEPDRFQLGSGVHQLDHDVVVHCHIPGGFVGHVHVMPLVCQPDKGAAHGDDVIVGMRRENKHLFGIRRRSDGPGSVIASGLSSRPAGDGMLKFVEGVYIDFVVTAIYIQEFVQ